MSNSRNLLAALVSSCLMLAACSTPSSEKQPLDAPLVQGEQTNELPRALSSNPLSAPVAGPPLPVGSQWIPASAYIPEETNFDAALRGTYRPDDKTPEERIPKIVQRGRLIVGVDQSHNLLSYRDASSGQLEGFEADLAREIAQDIFGDRDRVDFRFLESAERSRALEQGTVDIVIRTMTITPDREKDVAFSQPYMSTKTRMLVLSSSGINSIDETSGRTICSVEGSTALDKVSAIAPDANLLITRSWGDCLMSLQLGQANAVVVDDTLLSGMVAQDPYTSIVGGALDNEVYGVGVRRPDKKHDSRGLIRQVNSTLDRIMNDGTWLSMFNQWFGQYLPVPTIPAPNYIDEGTDKEKKL